MKSKKLIWTIIVCGLILSIGFLCYYKYSKHQASSNTETCGLKNLSDSLTCCDKDSTSDIGIENLKLSIQSEITCPKCNTKKTESMPTDVCMLSYTCQNCKTVLHPQDGDCCVFCTYGTHKCPSKQ